MKANSFFRVRETQREKMARGTESQRRQMAKKLRVYAGTEHENQAQKPEVWEVK